MLVLSSESIFPIYWILSLPCKGESYSMPFPKPVQPLSCISSSVEQRHVAFYLLSAASKLLNRWKRASQSAGERRHEKKGWIRGREDGGGETREGVGQPVVCGRSATSRVWEVFVKYLWVGEAGQIRPEKAAEIAAVSWINSENLLCLSASSPRII